MKSEEQTDAPASGNRRRAGGRPFQPGNSVGKRFQPGQSGNPAGRPKGSYNYRSQVAAEIMADEAAGQAHREALKAAMASPSAAVEAGRFIATLNREIGGHAVQVEGEAVPFVLMLLKGPVGRDPLAEAEEAEIVRPAPRKALPAG